jgi:hypothetical protein
MTRHNKVKTSQPSIVDIQHHGWEAQDKPWETKI